MKDYNFFHTKNLVLSQDFVEMSMKIDVVSFETRKIKMVHTCSLSALTDIDMYYMRHCWIFMKIDWKKID